MNSGLYSAFFLALAACSTPSLAQSIDQSTVNAQAILIGRVLKGETNTGTNGEASYQIHVERTVQGSGEWDNGPDQTYHSHLRLAIGSRYLFVMLPGRKGFPAVEAAMEIQTIHEIAKPDVIAAVVGFDERRRTDPPVYLLPGVRPHEKSVEVTDNSGATPITFKLVKYQWYPLETVEAYFRKSFSKSHQQ